MEITKQNQTFKINDTTSEGWTITGSATQDVDGMANVNITSNPESLDAFIDYAQTATQKIKDYLANQTISK